MCGRGGACVCAVVGVRAWCVTDICHHVQNKVGSEDKDCVETLCVEMPDCPRDRIKARPVAHVPFDMAAVAHVAGDMTADIHTRQAA